MNARIDEIADRVFRISCYTSVGPPGGITFNQFLIDADEPALVHTGMNMHFDDVVAQAATVVDASRLRWITSNHASRPDEFGALPRWFARAPHAAVAHGTTGCRVNLPDLSDRPLRPLGDGEVLDLGGRRLQWWATPHVPGPWEAGILVEQVTGVMFCGDLFAQAGRAPATSSGDIVGPAIAHDQRGHGTALTPTTAPTLRQLAASAPETLALMHGPAFVGDTRQALDGLATWFGDRFEDTRLRQDGGSEASSARSASLIR
jgi:flavorubredoxin